VIPAEFDLIQNRTFLDISAGAFWRYFANSDQKKTPLITMVYGISQRLPGECFQNLGIRPSPKWRFHYVAGISLFFRPPWKCALGPALHMREVIPPSLASAAGRRNRTARSRPHRETQATARTSAVKSADRSKAKDDAIAATLGNEYIPTRDLRYVDLG